MHPVYRRIINRRNVIILGAALLAGFAFWYFSDLQKIYGVLRDYFVVLSDQSEFLAGGLFFLLAMLSAILTFFSSTPLTPVAIEVFGRGTTFLLLITAWLAGGIIAYVICYHLRHFVERLSIFKRADMYRQKLSGRSEFLLIFLFRFAVPAEIGSYALGLLRYSFWKYVVVTVVAELPFAWIAMYSTSAFVDRQPLLFVAILFIGSVIVGVTAYLFYKRLKHLGGKPPKEDSEDDILNP